MARRDQETTTADESAKRGKPIGPPHSSRKKDESAKAVGLATDLLEEVSPRRRRVALNRLVPAHGCRVVCIATLWLLATMNASAQVQIPASPCRHLTSAVPRSRRPHPASALPTDAARGQQLLAQVRSAIASKDYHTAVQSFRQASAMTAKIPQLSGEVEKLRAAQEIGIDAALSPCRLNRRYPHRCSDYPM